METLKKIFRRLFVEAMMGLSMGIFATAVAGTIMRSIGMVIGGNIGVFLVNAGNIAVMLMGAGIGIGVAVRLSAPGIVTAAAAVAGFVSSYASEIVSGNIIKDDAILIDGMGDSLTAFIAVYIVVEIGCIIAGHTSMDYLFVPVVTITLGAIISMYIGMPISNAMCKLGEIINWSTEKNVLVMGAIVAVLMGLATTFPISSIALAMTLNLSGAAAGAATVGCCVNMIGFATASFRDNKVEGFILQSMGSSKVQMPNIIKNPLICLPIIITSAILGPISIGVGNLASNTTGAGMGSCGFVAQLMTYQTMINSGVGRNSTIIQIILLQFILPAIVTWVISEGMRGRGLIKDNDMKLAL